MDYTNLLSRLNSKIKLKLMSSRNFSSTDIELKMPHINIIAKWYLDELEKINKKITIKKGMFIDKRTKIGHYHLFDLTKNNNSITFLTDYKKAEKNDNYGMNPLFKKVIYNKESTVLEVPKNEIILQNKEGEASIFPLLKSAHENEHNPLLLSDIMIDNIDTFNDIIKNVEIKLKNIYLNEEGIFIVNKELIDIIYEINLPPLNYV